LNARGSRSLSFRTNSTERLRVSSAGHVGINDNNPDTRLSVNSGATNVVAKFASTDQYAWIQFRDNSTTDTAVMIGADGDNLLLRSGSNERVRVTSSGTVKFATNNSSTDYLQWGSNPRLFLQTPTGINGLRIYSDTTPFEIGGSASTRKVSMGGNPNYDLSISASYSLSSGGHDSSPKVFLNATRHNGSSTVTSFQTSIQAVSVSNTASDGYLGLGGSATPDDLVIRPSGNIGINETDPYYKLHLKTNNAATSLSGGGNGNWGSDGIRIENTNTTAGSMSLAHFRNYDADWHIGSKYVASNNSNFVFLVEGSEKLRIDANGNVKIGTIADTAAAVTNTPLYIAMQTDLTTFEGSEGAATTGLLRLEDTGSNNNRYHGIEIRNKNFGDIRILNQDVTTSDRGNLVIAMPDADASDGVHRKLVFNSLASAIQISGKGGAVAGNGAVESTDIYLATKTGVTSIDTGAGNAVAGLIRFEDIGSNNNRYHGIEIRNRNSGDARILNLDEGTTNRANLVFGVDNGSSVTEAMRIASSTDIGINTTNPLAKLHVNLLKSSGGTTAERTKQHAAMRLSLDRTTGSMPYLGWGPALDFYSDNYDGGTQRPNARIAGTISNYSAGDEGGQLRFYTTPTDTATSESDFVERYRIESSGMIRHSGGHGNNGGNMGASAYYRINASYGVPASGNVTFVVSGLAAGWMTIRGGGYSNAGQSQYALMYQLGGYMTATNTYNIETVQQWGSNVTINTQKNASDFRITLINGSGSYTLSTNWCIEGSNAGIKIRT